LQRLFDDTWSAAEKSRISKTVCRPTQ